MNNLLFLATIQILQAYAHTAQSYLASNVECATALINNLSSV
jgi:hypothetical protein